MPALGGALERLKSAVARSDGDLRLFAIAYLALLPFFLWPIAVVAPLFPGLDLPFHLSMVDLLVKTGRPDSPYAPYYQGVPTLAPYAAHYLVLAVMAHVMSILTAHTILVILYVASLPLVMAALLGVLGRSRLPALLAFPLAYNLPLHYGFISFAFSLPVVVLLLALLARLLLAERPITRLWIATAVVAVVLFLCHLQNFVYGICAAVAFAVFAAVPWRRRLVALASFLPSAAVAGWWRITLRPDPWHRPHGLAAAWAAVKAARKRDLPRVSNPWLVDLWNRVTSLPENALKGFTDGSDRKACEALMLLVGVYFLLGLVGRFLIKAKGGPPPRMRASVWVAFLGALAAFYLLPHHLNEFDIVTFHPRFAPLVLLMMLPLVPRGLRRFSGLARVTLVLPAAAFCVLWGLELVRHYRMYAAETADFRAVIAAAQPGHRLIGLMFERRSRTMRVESAMIGMGNYYPLLRPAPASMAPLLYCNMQHMPCVKNLPLDQPPDPSVWLPGKMNADQAVPFYDYFLARSPPPAQKIFGRHEGEVQLVIHQGGWWLWKKKGVN